MGVEFGRIYLEITNCCNLRCSFCPGTRRPARFLSEEEFAFLAGRLRGCTRFLYLHVMGEPLLHPALGALLEICRTLEFRVVLTTNGTLLPARQAELLSAPALHKLSISLHSLEANAPAGMQAYLSGCVDFAQAARRQGIITDFRLWNLNGAHTVGQNAQNGAILAFLHEAFPEPWQKNTWGWRLGERTFVHFAEKFDWPDPEKPDHGASGRCRALSDQLAVMCDGTVVPCCLDAEGRMALGNLFESSLEEILAAEPAAGMRAGFAHGVRTQPLCRRCGFSTRFSG